MTEKTVIGSECRFAIHMPPNHSDEPDLHLIKEIVHYSDGTTAPNIRFKRDYKRSFYVTLPQYRNHKQKKESEPKSRLREYWCTQSQLPYAAARALNQYGGRIHLKGLAASPYLYGSDITSTALIKHEETQKNPNLFSEYRVAFFDIETDMLHGTNDPILATTVFNGEIYCVYQASFYKDEANVEARLHAMASKHIQKYLDEEKLTIQFVSAESAVDLIAKSFAWIHARRPDFVAIWNMDFDVPRLLDTLKKYDVDAKDIFSDPVIPPHRRFAEYKKGQTKKVTSSGVTKPMPPSMQWHSLYCPASFYIIDAMCAYRYLRQGEQEESSYKLNAILDKVLGIRKLSFKEADHLVDGPWHSFMQERYPFEYAIYNIFDCVSMLCLDKKTSDLRIAFPVQARITDFAKFSSQTKRFADNYHVHLLHTENEILATIPPMEKKADVVEYGDSCFDDDEGDSEIDSDEEETEEEEEARLMSDDAEVLSLRQWIVTLSPRMSVLGLQLIKEDQRLRTLIRFFVSDSDAVSAYPSCTAVANVSKATTLRELIGIVGVDEAIFRTQNLNLLHGHVNALEYCNQMFNLPKPQELLEYF